MNQLHQRVIQVIASLATVPVQEIRPEDRLREDLGMDSITSMELVSALAEELSLEIEVEEAIEITTVRQVMEMASARLSGVEPHGAQ